MSLKLGKASDIINIIDNICKLGINFMPLSLRGVLEHPEHPPGYATVSCVSGLYSLVATSIRLTSFCCRYEYPTLGILHTYQLSRFGSKFPAVSLFFTVSFFSALNF